MNPDEKTRITVDIYGTHYKLVGKTTVSYMKMVAAHVNDHMHRIADVAPRLDSAKIAVLAAVNIADEYLTLKNDLDKINADQNKSEEFQLKYHRIHEQYTLLKEQKAAQQDQHTSELAQMREQHEEQIQQLQAQFEERLMQERNHHETEAQNEHSEELELRKELEETKLLLSAQEQKDNQYAVDYENLQSEYEKLKKEYNEWIELVIDKDEPKPN